MQERMYDIMRKNKMMRAASGLMVLTMLSTCAISGTFAKYVTSDSAEDSARVAKFGVEVTAWDDALFSKNYEADNETVVSSTEDLLVAPGTKNDVGVSFSITGRPEVDVRVAFDMNVNSDVIVPAGTYLDWTTGSDKSDTFTLDKDYTPVVFTLVNEGESVATGTLTEIESYLEGLNKVYEANTDLSTIFGAYTLTWAWDFEDNDKADTLLGNKAADLAKDGAVKTDIDYEIAITVTQVD